LSSLLFAPVPCQKRMAGEKLCFVAAVVVAAVYETEKVQKI
jgi:hypothetical protein